MYRLLSKLSKIAIACAVAAGTFVWGSQSTTYALSKPAMDKGLQDEIREELGLPGKEPVTMDEVAILTSLVIDNAESISSLQGLGEAVFLHSVIINGSHGNLDIAALTEVPELSLLAIDPDRLNEAGQKVVAELVDQGVNLVRLDEDSDVPSDKAPIQVYIDGELMDFKIDPVVKNGNTLVQFRPLFEKFGLQVGWDQATRKVTGTKQKLKIELTIDSKTATVGGRATALAAAPALISGNTMVPLRFIGEATGRKVVWDGETRTVFIVSTIASSFLELIHANMTVHSGDTVNGVPHGKGTLTIGNIQLYKGDFVNGVIEGKGTMYSTTERNSYYEGEFKNNRFHGTAKFVFGDGSYYEGSFADGMMEGNGKLFFADGTLLYIGSLSGDQMHGEGTIYIDSRTYYIGEFNHNKPEGKGKVYIEGKLDFEGKFANGVRYYGKNYVDGKLNFEGYFANNVPDGYGTVYSDNGNKYYRGQIKNNNITGVGIYYMDDGSRYVGEVYNDFMDGFGFIRQKDGITITQLGYWVEDEFIGEEAPEDTDDTRIRQLSRNADYSYVDGMYQNEYDLDRSEAIMFIELSSQDQFRLFNSLSKEAKVKFVNSFVQDHWGDVLGVDNCYVYIKFDDKIYAEATISYEMADGSVVIKEYPRGNGAIHNE